jgi:hypothetical protein
LSVRSATVRKSRKGVAGENAGAETCRTVFFAREGGRGDAALLPKIDAVLLRPGAGTGPTKGRAAEEREWNGQAQRLGGLEVDNQIYL